MATGRRNPSFVSRPAANRRPSSRPPARRRPSAVNRAALWRRGLPPHSAFGAVLLVTVLAVVVALVATLVYATIDAGRPIAGGPTTLPSGPTESTPSVAITEPQTTSTKVPENLPPDALTAKVSASIRLVKTLDEEGRPVEGTAFVVGSFGGQTLLLTSLALVLASTRAPAPTITLGDTRQATLWTWQESRDLALLVIPGSIESLPWVDAAGTPKPGDRLFTVKDGKLVTGVILNSSLTGIEHNVFVDDKLQGAPLVNQKGEVLAMASRAYNPDGRGTETVFTGVPIALACDQVVRCGQGNTSASSAPGSSTSTTAAR